MHIQNVYGAYYDEQEQARWCCGGRGMIKRPEEVALLAESGRLLTEVFAYLDRFELAGMSTMPLRRSESS